MASLMLVIAVTAFLAGAASAVFAMLVIGIRKADRPRSLPGARSHPAGRRHPHHATCWHLARRSRPRRPRSRLTGTQPGPLSLPWPDAINSRHPRPVFPESVTTRQSRIPAHFSVSSGVILPCL